MCPSGTSADVRARSSHQPAATVAHWSVADMSADRRASVRMRVAGGAEPKERFSRQTGIEAA